MGLSRRGVHVRAVVGSELVVGAADPRVVQIRADRRSVAVRHRPRAIHPPTDGAVGGLHRLPVASAAVLAPVTKVFVNAVHSFVRRPRSPDPVGGFAKGQRKDDVAREYLAAFQAAGGTEGVLFIGRAQET
jgi:hypothetical protein